MVLPISLVPPFSFDAWWKGEVYRPRTASLASPV